MRTARLLTFALLALGIAGYASATPEVGGLLGICPALENSYAAVWVPVPDGQAIVGMRWYNNDATTVFPAILVASGTIDERVGLSDAMEVATNVQGSSLGWSQVNFSVPVACESSGLYCLIVFPEGSEYVAPGAGGGAAIGYTVEDENRSAWLCSDAETWTRLEGSSGLAIEPVFVAAQPGMIALARQQAPVQTVAQTASLNRAFPNPFNPQTVIEYSLPVAGEMSLSIYDLSGRLIRRLEHGERPAGTHSVVWTGTDDTGRRLPSGVYFARFVAGSVSQHQRLVLVK